MDIKVKVKDGVSGVHSTLFIELIPGATITIPEELNNDLLFEPAEDPQPEPTSTKSKK